MKHLKKIVFMSVNLFNIGKSLLQLHQLQQLQAQNTSGQSLTFALQQTSNNVSHFFVQITSQEKMQNAHRTVDCLNVVASYFYSRRSKEMDRRPEIT